MRPRKAWQAWHFLDTAGNALVAVSLTVSGPQGVADEYDEHDECEDEYDKYGNDDDESDDECDDGM